MRAWLSAAAASARLVAGRPAMWLPGALAWTAGVGWIPFVVAVARPPSVAELTFLGARIATSGAWPWNAVLIATICLSVVLLAFVLVAAGNTVLLALLDERSASVADAGRLLGIGLITALPAGLALAFLVLALASVAPGEFNAPEDGGGPVLRTVVAVAPHLGILLLAAVLGAAHAAVAGRLAVRDGLDAAGGLRAALRAMMRGRAATVAQVAASAMIQLTFLAFAVLLLGVLWAPIGAQLGRGGEMGLATGLLLVGFVAIWLCLVLAGGALHAWSATTWSRLLAAGPRPMLSQRT